MLLVAPPAKPVTYEGERLSLVFTTPAGGLVLRQTVAKLAKQAAKTAGITAQLATHTGRRSVITNLYADGNEDIDDIARFVGHSNPRHHGPLRQTPRQTPPSRRHSRRRPPGLRHAPTARAGRFRLRHFGIRTDPVEVSTCPCRDVP